jgi:hypothetical protein
VTNDRLGRDTTSASNVGAVSGSIVAVTLVGHDFTHGCHGVGVPGVVEATQRPSRRCRREDNSEQANELGHYREPPSLVRHRGTRRQCNCWLTLHFPPTISDVTILDAVSDTRLGLASHCDRESFRSWRVFLEAAFGLPVSDHALYRQCTGRTDAPERAHREVWAIVGRR